ncbi:MAG: hypothetical protein HKP61_08705 [Dactylosporangium sp.]|nr:hypothetical protein [Dactylosporangium sp.]NNJ61014.1 hypothetical protein [Dactylosporangium sp.]
MFWAIISPVSAAGLIGGFLIGAGLRVVAHRLISVALGLRGWSVPTRPSPREDLDPIGAVSVVLAGVGWGRGVDQAPSPARRGTGRATEPVLPDRTRRRSDRGRSALAMLGGPVAAVAAGQLSLAAYVTACPTDHTTLLLNRPSDILRGAVAPTLVGELILSSAVALLVFGLVALLPVPPLDGSRIVRLALTDRRRSPNRGLDLAGSVLLLVLAVVPVDGMPPLLTVLDLVGTPMLRLWT